MTLSRFRRAAGVIDRVNLGNLYSLSQSDAYMKGSIPSMSPYRYIGLPSHGVNLGDLYKGAHRDDYVRQPLGWAYFEDGSIFVARSRYDHNDFQRAMNIVAPFVRNPSDATDVSKRKNRPRTRLILIEKPCLRWHFDPGQFDAYARYANDGEEFFTPSMPFSPLFLTLDPTQTFPVSITWSNQAMQGLSYMRSERDMKQLISSLQTFRGTLYDGLLQPNVRPSNGLEFSISLPPKRLPWDAPVVQKEATLERRQGRIRQPYATPQQSEPKSQYSREKINGSHMVRAKSSSKPSYEHKPEQTPDPRIAQFNAKALQLKAWARKLMQKEVLLGRKHKALKLEQELALARKRSQEEPHKAYARQPSAAVGLRKSPSTSARQGEHLTDTRSQKPRDNREEDKWDIAAANAAKAKEGAKSAAQAQPDNKNPVKVQEEVDLIPEFLNQDETLPSHALEWLRKRKRG